MKVLGLSSFCFHVAGGVGAFCLDNQGTGCSSAESIASSSSELSNGAQGSCGLGAEEGVVIRLEDLRLMLIIGWPFLS